jgi:hypothetical protein
MADILLIQSGEGGYLHEILRHAGLFYDTRSASSPPPLLPSSPLLIVHAPTIPARLADDIRRHVADGGLLLCVGHCRELEDVLGVTSPHDATEGWLDVRPVEHPAVRGLDGPLHVFGGTTVALRGADELAVLNGRAAVTWHRYGRGYATLLGADVPGSVLHIQQGVPVRSDGAPAPDGTASLDDGILKAEDGLVLDWERDRQIVHVARGLFPGRWGGGAALPEDLPPADQPQPFPLFLEPVADGLRALLLQSVFALASAGGVSLPVLWYWPRGMAAVGHISHDSDGNQPDVAEELRAVCRESAVPTTWCILYPGGYAPAFYRRLRDEQFEIALHYDALTGGTYTSWSRENLHIQAQWLRDMSGVFDLPSNKNHYTRWEGRLEFFRWCEDEGIRVEQSKGPSKTGVIGFPFGTCHPWAPLDDEEGTPRRLDVLSLPLMTQDLVITAPAAYAELLTDAARKHYGVAHFLYHPAHIAKPGVADSFRHLVAYAREQGMEWWTSAQIRQWEDIRGAVRLEMRDGRPHLHAPARAEDATLLQLLPADRPCPTGWQEVTRYGFRFAQRVETLDGDAPLPTQRSNG